MDLLPAELLLHLLHYLPDAPLLNASLTGKHIHSLARGILRERRLVFYWETVYVQRTQHRCGRRANFSHPIFLIDALAKDPEGAKYVKQLHWHGERDMSLQYTPTEEHRDKPDELLPVHSWLEAPLRRLVAAGVITEVDKNHWQISPKGYTFGWLVLFLVIYSILPNLECVDFGRILMADDPRVFRQINRLQCLRPDQAKAAGFASLKTVIISGSESQRGGPLLTDILPDIMFMSSLRTIHIRHFDHRTMLYWWGPRPRLTAANSDGLIETRSKVQHFISERNHFTPKFVVETVRDMPDLISYSFWHHTGFHPPPAPLPAVKPSPSELDQAARQQRLRYYRALLGHGRALFRERGLLVLGLNGVPVTASTRSRDLDREAMPYREMRGLLICKPGYQVPGDTFTEEMGD